MSDKKIWFGTLYDTQKPGTSTATSNTRMSWIPAPDTGMDAGSSGFSEVLEFENGGASVIGSAATHRTYGFDWNLAEASGLQGLDMVRNYQQKVYGTGTIYWANPMIFDQNVFSPSFSSPLLCQFGWPSFGIITGYSYTAGSLFNNPSTYATVSADHMVPNAVPLTQANHIQVVAIPPTHTAWVGWSGSVNGAAILAVRGVLAAGGYGPVVSLPAQSVTGSTRMTNSFSGATYKAIEVYVTRTAGTANSLLYMVSAMCQLWPTGVTPILTGNHIHGQGDTGVRFASNAQVENYVMVDTSGTPRHYKGMSADLVEVGAWVR